MTRLILKSIICTLTVFLSLASFSGLQAYQYHVPDNAVSSGTAGAFTAYQDHPDGTVFNPASFFQVKDNVINVNYNRYFSGLDPENGLTEVQGYYPVSVYSYSLQSLVPLGNTAGIGVVYDKLNYSSLNEFTILGLSVSLPLSRLLSLENEHGFGISVKYLQNNYLVNDYNEDFLKQYGFYSSGFAFDTGFLFSLMPDLKLGISFINLVSTDMGLMEEDSLPVHYRFGINYFNPVSFLGFREMRLLTDFEYCDRDYSLYAGIEFKMKSPALVLRTGVNFDYFAFGLGYEYDSSLSFNYTVNYYISDLDGTGLNHKINTGVKF